MEIIFLSIIKIFTEMTKADLILDENKSKLNNKSCLQGNIGKWIIDISYPKKYTYKSWTLKAD